MLLEGTLARFVFAVLLVAALLGSYKAITALVLARARGKVNAFLPFVPGKPGVVFFTTPDCVTCKAAQRPALAELADRMPGTVQVIEVDALDNAALAREWSVLSVPTTFVLDRSGRPRQVNHGYASTEKLIGQIVALGT
jgi:thiol-disulfide isomerase/thioredoxin